MTSKSSLFESQALAIPAVFGSSSVTNLSIAYVGNVTNDQRGGTPDVRSQDVESSGHNPDLSCLTDIAHIRFEHALFRAKEHTLDLVPTDSHNQYERVFL